MRRVLFHLGGIHVYSYPAMLYIGLILGITAGNYAANALHADSARIFVATLVLLIPALAGARILFVISHWESYRREPRRIWRRGEGGAALYGGLLLALPLSAPLLRALRISFPVFWDINTFTMLTGMVFTRIGCLLNGCCAGRPHEGLLALRLKNLQEISRRRYPTQLLESVWAAVILSAAVVFWNRMPFPGCLFLCAAGAYSAGRFVLEFTSEHWNETGKLTLHQTISAALATCILTVLLIAWPRQA